MVINFSEGFQKSFGWSMMNKGWYFLSGLVDTMTKCVSSNEEESIPMTSETEMCKKPFGVNFNSLLKVVLIPSREEYRKAQCDLWWTGNDFFSFKQAARSEIKLLAIYENICMTEARRKLYQPGEKNTTLEDNEDDSYYNKENDSESQMLSPGPKISAKQSLHTVSSIPSINKLTDSPDSTEISRKKLSLDDQFFNENLREEHDCWLCVPLEEPGILSTKERPSRRSQTQLSEQMVILISFICFAFPMVGYYYIYFS